MNTLAQLKRLFTKRPPPPPPVEVIALPPSNRTIKRPSTAKRPSATTTKSPTTTGDVPPTPLPKLKRVRTPRSPRQSPPNRSPLIRRNPRMLGEGEYFISDGEGRRDDRESTPRFKRPRRSGDFELATSRFARDDGTGMTDIVMATGPIVGGPMPKPEPDAMEMAETEQELDEAQQRRLLTEEHGFTNQEAQLFLRIKNRGFEPLMPAHWQVDFGTMPDNLFFAAHEVGHIDSITLHGTFKATSAFQALVNLGGLVRTKQEVRKDPEEMILGVLRKYIVWSVEDVRAGLKGHPDIHPRIVLAGSYGKGPKHCEAKMQRRLVELATELRNEEATLASLGTPREPSASATLYGLAVSGCVVALVSLDARNTAAPMPKTLALLDFSDTTLDFWNAVAIALLVIGARDDEIERHEFYAGCALRKPPVSEARRRGWEKRRAGTGDEDA